jgi:hypothetical protein
MRGLNWHSWDEESTSDVSERFPPAEGADDCTFPGNVVMKRFDKSRHIAQPTDWNIIVFGYLIVFAKFSQKVDIEQKISSLFDM